jgi:predicted nucleotidyltransferase
MYNKENILDYLKQIKPKLEDDGIVSLGLFGSFATNENKNQSDIDILIETSDEFINKYRGFKAFSRLEEIRNDISNKFNNSVDIFDKNSPNSAIKEQILKEVIYV